MTCLEAQGLITPFINDQLESDRLKSFIEHINNCDDCREELEVYYTLLTGMKLLDEEKILSDNFHMDLENKIRKTEERIKHTKRQIIAKYVVLIGVIFIIAIVSSVRIGEYVVEQENKQNKLSLRYYYYGEQTIPLDVIIENEYKNRLASQDNYKELIKKIR